MLTLTLFQTYHPISKIQFKFSCRRCPPNSLSHPVIMYRLPSFSPATVFTAFTRRHFTLLHALSRDQIVSTARQILAMSSHSLISYEIELTSSQLGPAFLRNGCSLLIVGNSMVYVVALLPSRQVAYSAAWQFLGKVRGHNERPHESLSSRTTSIIREAARPCQPAP